MFQNELIFVKCYIICEANTLVLSCLKRLLSVILLFSCLKLSGQERTVEGIVFDRDSKQRISRVYIYNLRKHTGFYNNIKGEFSTKVATGDTLIAAAEGYRVDTLTVRSQAALLFYLKQTSIHLREVTVTDTARHPRERLKQLKREYKDIYRKGDPQDLLTIGGGNGAGGAGLGIDALYSLLSKEGKNARYLQEIIERDYREMMINYRYTKSLVKNVTGLPDEKLEDFMQQYRPSYYFILEASDYSLISFIRDCYKQYLKDPSAYRLPPLKSP